LVPKGNVETRDWEMTTEGHLGAQDMSSDGSKHRYNVTIAT